MHYKVSSYSDAEDILQNVLSVAFAGFGRLSYASRFKQWIIGIASNRCVDYKEKAKSLEIPLDAIAGQSYGSHVKEIAGVVQDTLNRL